MIKKEHLIIIGSTSKHVRKGGIPSYVNELERYLDKCYSQYTLLEISEEKYETDRKKKYATLKDNYFLRCWLLRKEIKKIAKKNQRIAFSIHYWRELIFSLDIILKNDFILHFHGPAYLEAKLENKSKFHITVAKWYEKIMYPKAKYAICLSHEFKNVLNELYNVDKEKISVIPYGFQLNGIKQLLPTQNKKIQIVCVRRLVKRVGIELLIKACKKLKDQSFEFELTIIGEGYLYQELLNIVHCLNLEGHVKLLGKIPDKQLKQILLKSDLAVMPSIALEGFGISTVECLYHGVPVIGTNIGGTTGILKPLDPNLIIEKPSTEKIYEKLYDILTQEISLPSREECHQYAIKNYDIEKIGSQIKALYHDVCP